MQPGKPTNQKISVLCVSSHSNYFLLPRLDLWTAKRNAANFNGTNPVISHAPCAQWSKLRAMSHRNEETKMLAPFCFEKVIQNGGIFEHPLGSSIFKYMGVKPTIIVDQYNWGHRTKKPTALFFSKCEPLTQPFRLVSNYKRLDCVSAEHKIESPMDFCLWLIRCIDINYNAQLYPEGTNFYLNSTRQEK